MKPTPFVFSDCRNSVPQVGWLKPTAISRVGQKVRSGFFRKMLREIPSKLSGQTNILTFSV